MLWCMYYLQGILYAKGGMVSQGLLLIILLLSLRYMFITLTKYRPPVFLKALAVFMGLFLVYTLLSYLDATPIFKHFVLERRVPTTYSLKVLLMSLLPIFVYYYFGCRALINEGSLQKYFIIFIVLTTLMFIQEQNELMANAVQMRSLQEDFVNNVAYNFLQMMPFLLLLNNKSILQYGGLIVIMVFLVLGMKRGALLIGVICFLYFLFETLKNTTKSKKITISVLMICVSIFFVYFVQEYFIANEFFQNRIEYTLEGDSSGRDVRYGKLFDHLMSQNNIASIVFGGGLYETVRISGNYAHNDWLELGVNMGLVGIVIYILYYVAFIKSIFDAKRAKNNVIKTSLIMCGMILFASSLFSMSYDSISVPLALVVGYSLSQTTNVQRVICQNKK